MSLPQNSQKIIIKTVSTEKEFAECEKILRSLPDWFGQEDSNDQYAKDIRKFKTYVAFYGTKIIGFVNLKKLTEKSMEVNVTGVYKEFHRQGVGHKLFAFIFQDLQKAGVNLLKVDTLSDKHSDTFYAQTRAFYHKIGFIDLEESDKWGPDNPCLTLIKPLV